MRHFNEQLVNDLEFHEVRILASSYAKQPTAAKKMLALSPIGNLENWKWTLGISNELKSLILDGTVFPPLDFQEFSDELKMLRIADSVLSEESFERILRGIQLIGKLKSLPDELMEGVPHFRALMESCEHSTEVEEAILKIFDAKWKVRDEASGELHSIRQEIAQVRREITKNFQRIFKDCQGKGFLGDSGESYLYDRRVLSVFSTYKRKVSGNVLGTSKTGAITYIEPSANILLNSQLEMLFGDERAEIRKILQRLTKYLASHSALLHTVHKTLLQLDDLQARARLAIALNASQVVYSEQPVVHLLKAFHPLLYLKNLERKVATVPQHILLNQDQRMMVISGPNAGGKSITLKTVGLLQLMWECGLMVPAAENSVMSRFDCVLTDIGDNQSIENQLSTYSYRLKRMKFFLESANKRSLVLLDEFGTGSDPELGGALAEVFFEELYSKRTFGVITTHFSPIKVKASQLRNAINGCMLFDTKTLAPTYQLSIGEPGSSFTFEVAKMNGIPEELLGRAKKKLSSQKIKMDGLLTDLQKQKSELDHAMKEATEQTKRAKKEEESYLHKVGKLEEKLAKQQLLAERNNKYIIIGKRMDSFIDQYNLRTKNKEVMEELKKYVAIEKTSRMEASMKKKLQGDSKKKQAAKEKKVRDKSLMVAGATVRLEKTQQVGQIMDVVGEVATVAFGNFKTKVELEKLWLIK